MKGQINALTVCLTAVSLTVSHVCGHNILHICSHVLLLNIRDLQCQGAGWGDGRSVHIELTALHHYHFTDIDEFWAVAIIW